MKHQYKQARKLPEFIKGGYYPKSLKEFEKANVAIQNGVAKRNRELSIKETYDYFLNRFKQFK